MKKKILFISATHGEEGFSIKVLDGIERKYPKNLYGYERIVGNPKALRKKIRYVDSNLKHGIQGESVAQDLSRKGFKNLFLATGYQPEAFKLETMTWIQAIVGKSPPWQSL